MNLARHVFNMPRMTFSLRETTSLRLERLQLSPRARERQIETSQQTIAAFVAEIVRFRRARQSHPKFDDFGYW